MTKTHWGDVRDEKSQKGKMYEICVLRCQVLSFEKSGTKLHPHCDNFWELSNRNFDPNKSTPWYVKIPLGKNTLGMKMSKFSSEVNLSCAYINHCFCTTCIIGLDQSGFEPDTL